MKRFLAAMTLGMVLVVGTVSAQAADLSVTLNGAAITFDAQPFMEQDITFVPVRAIMDSLNANVVWNPTAKTVTVTKGDKTIVLTIGSNQAVVNGQAVELEAAAKIVENRTFVPVKFIAEQLDLNVEWSEQENIVSLTDVVVEPEEDTTPTEEEVTAPAEGETESDSKDETKDEDEADSKDEAKDEDEADSKDEAKDEDKTEADSKDETKDEDEADSKDETKDEDKTEADSKDETKDEDKTEADSKDEAKDEDKTEADSKDEAKDEDKTEADSKDETKDEDKTEADGQDETKTEAE